MKKWLLAARIHTLSAIISPVILGSVLAYKQGYKNIILTLIILIAAILIQIGTNFANDVYDFEKGTDREDRIGPIRATQTGLISPKQIKIGMILTFTLAIILGFYLANIGGIPIVLIGLISIVSGIAYTGGPYPLGYYGLGDIFVIIFFGLIAVSGTYYLHTNEVTLLTLIMGATMGMLSNAILVVNNLRDIKSDKISRKHTLAVRYGVKFSRIQYTLLLIIPLLSPIYLWYMYRNILLILIMFLIIPISIN